jgi:hypothetical protein
MTAVDKGRIHIYWLKMEHFHILLISCDATAQFTPHSSPNSVEIFLNSDNQNGFLHMESTSA